MKQIVTSKPYHSNSELLMEDEKYYMVVKEIMIEGKGRLSTSLSTSKIFLIHTIVNSG